MKKNSWERRVSIPVPTVCKASTSKSEIRLRRFRLAKLLLATCCALVEWEKQDEECRVALGATEEKYFIFSSKSETKNSSSTKLFFSSFRK
ncbi:hypothetical protein NPIL_610331 [Nephila pilipes]|uniref:Uncharacterized protein n=1 Tax=Nephila pilipes TaxID=299642 RepID=A0A8X6TH46_NEPPI|nr:hypothetical protein NPIL_307461 [Nephila pilipes]GFT10334.1 hypothetical protein NPIL_610331 [Nephila pilipes]